MTRKKDSDEERGMSLLAIDQYMRQVSWTPVATEAARDRLIEGMQRLVIALAKKWLPRFRGMELLDLIQEGNEALVRMVERSNLTDVEQLGALAGKYIHTCYLHALQRCNGYRIPWRAFAPVREMWRVQEQLREQSSREPTAREVAGAMGVSVEQVGAWEREAQRFEVASLEAVLEETANEDEESFEITLVSLFQQDEGSDQRRQAVLEAMVQRAIQTQLTGRQQEVVTRWYGLDRESESYGQIAQGLGIRQSVACQVGQRAHARLAEVLAEPYGKLCGQELAGEWYSAAQAAAVLGISQQRLASLVRWGHISRERGTGKGMGRYARSEVERLAAVRQERSA